MIKIKKDLELKGDGRDVDLAKVILRIDENIFNNEIISYKKGSRWAKDNWLHRIKVQINEKGFADINLVIFELQSNFGFYFKYTGLTKYGDDSYSIFRNGKQLNIGGAVSEKYYCYSIAHSCLAYIVEHKLKETPAYIKDYDKKNKKEN